ncbi:MAG: hypothetical protein ACFFG0_49340 [Candidatus Thorarchaeota archaeon]
MFKLKCFCCGKLFKDKSEIFRTENNYPYCQDCFFEYLDNQNWLEDDLEYIISEIKEKFNGNYKKWKNWFYETYDICEGCSKRQYDNIYHPKEQLTKINDKLYCEMCIEEI